MTSVVLCPVSEMMPSCCDRGSNNSTSSGCAVGAEVRRVRAAFGDIW